MKLGKLITSNLLEAEVLGILEGEIVALEKETRYLKEKQNELLQREEALILACATIRNPENRMEEYIKVVDELVDSDL